MTNVQTENGVQNNSNRFQDSVDARQSSAPLVEKLISILEEPTLKNQGPVKSIREIRHQPENKNNMKWNFRLNLDHAQRCKGFQAHHALEGIEEI
ncbi:hypothetical protein RvY_10018 [Ramazzottius varieornatus]|uniref:Uncharacterized protein n=1 Tax=Ramazzottius varieornatus TaxID=947166 RepID=A0A1D1VKD1_RAMVA|nr:hypothetical protein RvY_10018 [Ramazzottius varieornatus]